MAQVLKTDMNTTTERMTQIVLACCALHNYFIDRGMPAYADGGVVDREDIANNTLMPGVYREGIWFPATAAAVAENQIVQDVVIKNYEMKC